ncbi:MAG: phage head closure protein [Roseateles sp.]|uniref:phage head closure protein n=1 Tax=Roseateles sp. TaxID=1971397 RepID=UPI004036648D
MSAGAYNRRVSLQQPVSTQDALGQPVPGWTEVAPLWASIRHLNGMESIKADANISTVRASVRLRYRTGVTAGMRIVHGSTVYLVRAVLPDEATRQWVDLACEVVS